MKEIMWNPWHGCHKYSEGCLNCYMFKFDKERDIDSNIVYKTKDYTMPIKKDREGLYKLKSDSCVNVCLTSDFFIEEADEWRKDVWKMMKFRSDVKFILFTKRANRIKSCLPEDWGNGYPNVGIALTVENQKRIDERMPLFLEIKASYKIALVSPMLEKVNIEKYIESRQIDEVSCSGENYNNARPCDYEWVKDLSEQCKRNNVTFKFFHTGSNFIKNGKIYHIPYNKGKEQARKAYLDYKST